MVEILDFPILPSQEDLPPDQWVFGQATPGFGDQTTDEQGVRLMTEFK